MPCPRIPPKNSDPSLRSSFSSRPAHATDHEGVYSLSHSKSLNCFVGTLQSSAFSNPKIALGCESPHPGLTWGSPCLKPSQWVKTLQVNALKSRLMNFNKIWTFLPGHRRSFCQSVPQGISGGRQNAGVFCWFFGCKMGKCKMAIKCTLTKLTSLRQGQRGRNNLFPGEMVFYERCCEKICGMNNNEGGRCSFSMSSPSQICQLYIRHWGLVLSCFLKKLPLLISPTNLANT